MFGFGTKKNGIHNEYYSNGNINSEFDFKDGRKNGSFKVWHENGNLAVNRDLKRLDLSKS